MAPAGPTPPASSRHCHSYAALHSRRFRGERKGSLAGKKALVVGIANEHSIAWGCARAFAAEGADLALS